MQVRPLTAQFNNLMAHGRSLTAVVLHIKSSSTL